MAVLVDMGREPKTPLGRALYGYRMREGVSQAELAQRLGVSRDSVTKWEVGDYLPSLGKAIEMADLLGTSLDELVGRVPAATGRAG